jgi:hypothetical protein
VQRWGGPIEEIRPGDVVWTKEYHDGWMESVSDEQYTG